MAKRKSAPKKVREPKPPKPRYRFGIGEWYGQSFVNLSTDEKQQYAQIDLDVDKGIEVDRPPCPFLSINTTVPCWKPTGGICSLRSYQKIGEFVSINENGSTFRATCPSRFEEGRKIYEWISEVLLGTEAVPIGQVNFLERVPLMGSTDDEPINDKEGVGRIDNVLIVPGTSPLQWCPVEIQSVYFSGGAMENDYKAILEHESDEIPFPPVSRRLDYRSSAPKRLMPQLQIKVPTLRRWGKKMAVVIDQDFINNVGRMETVKDISNCDVAWFVVRFDESSGEPRLTRGPVYFTQLEAAIQGLVAGKPVTKEKFEERIAAKLANLGSGPPEIPADE